MKIKNSTFSARLIGNIQKLVVLQLVFITIAMSSYSYFSFFSELKATERLIEGQLITSLTKMLDYGELLYVQPLLESTVKASEGRFKIYVTLKKASVSDLIAFSGDSSVLGEFFKVQYSKKQFAPYFGEIQVDLTIGYSDQVNKSIWLLVLVIFVCGLLSYLLFKYIKKSISMQSLSVDELELVMNDIDTDANQSDVLTKAKSLILDYSNSKAKSSILESLEAQSKQVAHDIRSPLSALSMIVGTLKDLPEEKRILIRNATQRINDIANGLLQKSKSTSENKILSKESQDTSSVSTVEFIPALVDWS
jgi:signal transduction histidine kinase